LRQRIEPGRPAPEFTLARRDGSLLSLSDFRGKVVVLDFWASWCKPCRASFPWVREFYKEYKDKGIEIIGMSIDSNRASWEKALDEEQLPWPQVIDETVKGSYRVEELYHVLAVPMFVVVDKEGKIVLRAHMEKKELSAVVEEVLKK
jgi:peroxiredoxin